MDLSRGRLPLSSMKKHTFIFLVQYLFAMAKKISLQKFMQYSGKL